MIQASFAVTGISDIIDRFGKKKNLVLRAIEKGMMKGMLVFQKVVIEQSQLAGRAGDRYLNIQSGRLRRSWSIKRIGTTIDNVVVRLSSSAPYANIHQTGGTIQHPGGTPYVMFGTEYPEGFVHLFKNKIYSPQIEMRKKFTKPHQISIPKRLYIAEEFKTVGKELIMREVVSEVSSALKL